MNLGETATYCCLEGIFLCGNIPVQTASAQCLWRAGFDMEASHIFPQSVLAAITLVGGGAGDGMASAGAGCEAILSLFSVALTTLSGARSGPKLLEQKP